MRKIFASAGLVSMLLLPLASQAQENPAAGISGSGENKKSPLMRSTADPRQRENITTKSQSEKTGPAANCTQFLANIDQMAKRLSEAKTAFTKERTEKINDLRDKFSEAKGDLKDKNGETSKKINSSVERLSKRATTDEQKKAIADLQAALKAAQTKRAAAVQAAMDAFKTAAQNLQGQTNTAVSDAVTKFNAAVAAAVTQAKADCSGDNPDLGKAKRKFLTSVEQAKRTLMESAKGDKTNISDDLQKLMKTRNEAIRKAQQEFVAAVKAAIEKLRAAFGVPGGVTPTPPPTIQSEQEHSQGDDNDSQDDSKDDDSDDDDAAENSSGN